MGSRVNEHERLILLLLKRGAVADSTWGYGAGCRLPSDVVATAAGYVWVAMACHLGAAGGGVHDGSWHSEVHSERPFLLRVIGCGGCGPSGAGARTHSAAQIATSQLGGTTLDCSVWWCGQLKLHPSKPRNPHVVPSLTCASCSHSQTTLIPLLSRLPSPAHLDSSYNLEKIADEERDAALGNGGLGRLVRAMFGRLHRGCRGISPWLQIGMHCASDWRTQLRRRGLFQGWSRLQHRPPGCALACSRLQLPWCVDAVAQSRIATRVLHGM